MRCELGVIAPAAVTGTAPRRPAPHTPLQHPHMLRNRCHAHLSAVCILCAGRLVAVDEEHVSICAHPPRDEEHVSICAHPPRDEEHVSICAHPPRDVLQDGLVQPLHILLSWWRRLLLPLGDQVRPLQPEQQLREAGHHLAQATEQDAAAPGVGVLLRQEAEQEQEGRVGPGAVADGHLLVAPSRAWSRGKSRVSAPFSFESALRSVRAGQSSRETAGKDSLQFDWRTMPRTVGSCRLCLHASPCPFFMSTPMPQEAVLP